MAAAALIGYLVAPSPAQLGIADNVADAPPPAKDRWRQFVIATVIGLCMVGARRAGGACARPAIIFWSASALFFSKLAVVTFGGAYAVLAYMAQQAVETHHWMSAPEMVDGLGLAETTPGPLILVTQFVGFLAGFRNAAPFSPLLAGVLGAAMTTWVTFIPPMLWIFAGAPFIEPLRANRKLSGALAAITAAVVGVILNLSVWFALHVLFGQIDGAARRTVALVRIRSAGARLRAAALAAIAAVLAFRLHRGLIEVMVLMAALGVAMRLALGLAFARNRAFVPAPQHEVRERRQHKEDHNAGKRQQQQRREHARDVEPVARFGDAIGEAGARAGRARRDLGHHRADQRQPAGDAQAGEHMRQRRRQLQIATAPASARRL